MLPGIHPHEMITLRPSGATPSHFPPKMSLSIVIFSSMVFFGIEQVKDVRIIGIFLLVANYFPERASFSPSTTGSVPKYASRSATHLAPISRI